MKVGAVLSYNEEVEQCIEFIEKNIKKKLTPALIAKQCRCSAFHVCVIFNSYSGIPLMEYVKKRKVYRAALEIFKGKEVIDIPIEYGFNTLDEFLQDFKNEYGFNIIQYMKRIEGCYSDEYQLKKVEDYIINLTIIKKPAFKVAGYSIQTDITNLNYTHDIKSLWKTYKNQNIKNEMNKTVCICIPSDIKKGDATYTIGTIVDNFENITKDMTSIEIEETTYAVFTTSKVDTTNNQNQDEFTKAIKKTWRYIFEEWFVDSRYTLDENKIDFELYDEKSLPKKDAVMEIYIPVIEKQ